MTARYKKLLEEAASEIETWTAEEAIRFAGPDGPLFVDVRDSRELQAAASVVVEPHDVLVPKP